MSLQQLDSAAERFLAKVNRVNEPLTAFTQTEEFRQFRTWFAQAIKRQAGRVAADLKGTERVVPGQFVDDRFIPLSDLVDVDKVKSVLTKAFNWSVDAQIQRIKTRKAQFQVTNPYYLNQINDRASYLLNQSNIDDTTRDTLVDLIAQGTENGLTPDEIAASIDDALGDISATRADMIARTEVANAMGDGNLAFMKENNVATKHWVTAGDHPCLICEANEAEGDIPVSESFDSGDESEPAHPRCECYTEAGDIDLQALADQLWDGS